MFFVWLILAIIVILTALYWFFRGLGFLIALAIFFYDKWSNTPAIPVIPDTPAGRPGR
jgi:hypothetical protein